MENSLVESILRVCQALNKMQVEYMVVGGTAVAFHGYARISTASDGSPLGKHDLDFWYKPTLENYYRLLDAFDFLPQIKGHSNFHIVYQRKETTSLYDVMIPILSYDDLVKSKLADPRAKDIEDIRQLRTIRRSDI
jgi:hypothetical protein